MANTNDPAILDIAYTPFDNLCIAVTLNPDATTSREIIGSIAEGIKADSSDEAAMARFREIFSDPGLQMLSFTITEKGYKLYNPDGTLLPAVEADMKEGPHNTKNAMATLTKFLYWRYQAGGFPLAVCSSITAATTARPSTTAWRRSPKPGETTAWWSRALWTGSMMRARSASPGA